MEPEGSVPCLYDGATGACNDTFEQRRFEN
jgi:hypothetical protein